MKEKTITFIIGILVGAILTTGVFLLFGDKSNGRPEEGGQMRGQRMENFIPDDFKKEGNPEDNTIKDNLSSNHV